MLKITNHNDGGVTTLKLEGKLTGAWVHELQRCWQQVLRMEGGQSIRLDLAEVAWVSDEGRALLRLMQRHGAELLAANLLLAGLMAEVNAATVD
ncbi:MAG: hypothetical protein HYR56_15755 [Acidobacteria bacterium]|nr:hypothetical protein [Acidobacteriota bacterium]MBI3425156.1 hypothetical protein [Acidobacteriota bacterium]